ncbi:MAG: pyridoxamine 5'-phosphate oxidase family protein, partial [Pseudomonadota bacterium]
MTQAHSWASQLETTLETVWRCLADAPLDRHASMRFGTLATSGPRGAEARLVVLRRTDRSTATCEVYTDVQSAKVSELRADPRATLLFWDPGIALQIRLRASATIVAGDRAAEVFKGLPMPARRDYGSGPPPGTPLGPEAASSNDPDPGAVDRFCIIQFSVGEIETLHLGRDRHRRARFRPAVETQASQDQA